MADFRLGDEQRILIQQAIPQLNEFRTEFRSRSGAWLDLPVGTVDIEELRQMAILQDLFFEQSFPSHRPIVGPVISWLKKMTVKAFNTVLRLSLVRQVELNQRLWNMSLSVMMHDERLQKLEKIVLEKCR